MHQSRIANISRTQHVVAGLVGTVVIVAALLVDTDGLLSSSPRFYDDDPAVRDVDTKDASGVQPKRVNLLYDESRNLFASPGDREDRRALNHKALCDLCALVTFVLSRGFVSGSWV